MDVDDDVAAALICTMLAALAGQFCSRARSEHAVCCAPLQSAGSWTASQLWLGTGGSSGSGASRDGKSGEAFQRTDRLMPKTISSFLDDQLPRLP